VCYVDSTVALPILACYLIQTQGSREPKRLYARRREALDLLAREAKPA